MTSQRQGGSSPEERLILLSAGTRVSRTSRQSQAEQLSALVDWSALATQLHKRRLLPTLGPRLLELAGGRATASFADSVEHALAAGRRIGALMQLVGNRTIDALARAGIAATTLKGADMSELLYGDPGRRQASDIDLLVAPERLHEAVAVVRGLGYEAPTDPVDRKGLPLLHFALTAADGRLPPIELHWRIHWYERSFAHNRLLRPLEGAASSPGVHPADQLTALLLFYARDGFIDLRLATDLSAWWDRFGASLSPEALREVIESYPELARVVLAAAKVAERTVGIPIFTGTDLRLDVRGRLAARLASPHPHLSAPQMYADMGLIDGLLSPRGGTRAFVRRQILPSRAVLRERARRAPGARASSPLGHGVRVLGRYGVAGLRLLRRPTPMRLG